MKMMKKFPSIDQQKLKVLCDDLCDNIEDLLHHLGLSFKMTDKMISMACPIHGGDNIGAINLYHTGDIYRGNWKCRTHGCEKIFKGSIIGFLRGTLSAQSLGWQKNGDDTVSFKDTISFVESYLNKDLNSIKISKTFKDKQNFSYLVNNLKKTEDKKPSGITRNLVIKELQIPALYYLDRGYSLDILKKYDVGLCNKPNREMSNRVVVPIYDTDHKLMIGCTGRSIYTRCEVCLSFHDDQISCPDLTSRYLYSKWKHSHNFKSQNTLYNIWYAKEHIQKTGCAILVESPGNVWRLEEAGIHNSVGLFGCNLSDRQKIILDSSGAMSLVILTDNDEAGKQAAKVIEKKCSNTYRIYIPQITKEDIGEMSVSEIHDTILSFLKEIQ